MHQALYGTGGDNLGFDNPVGITDPATLQPRGYDDLSIENTWPQQMV
jgi:hypothetical protein